MDDRREPDTVDPAVDPEVVDPETGMTYREFEERYKKATGVLSEAVMKRDDVPATVYDLAKGALQSLIRYIDDETDEDISWENPWVETLYPIPWNPETWAPALERDKETEEVFFTPSELTDKERTVDALTRAYCQLMEIVALSFVTNGVVLTIAGEESHFSLLPWSEHDEELHDLQGEALENRMIELSHPFMLGDTLPDQEPFDIPSMPFELEVQGANVSGNIVVHFQVLHVDVEAERAYYPIVAGVAFENPPTSPPSTWPDRDKARLWGAMLRGLRAPFEEAGFLPDTPDVTLQSYPGSAIVAPPSTRSGIGLAFGPAVVSSNAMELVSSAHKVRLPSRWSNLPRWDDLAKAEVDRLLAEEGDRAFESLKETTGDPDERGPLLKRRFRAGGESDVSLTAEAERRLQRTHGLGRGFIEVNKWGHESLVRYFEVGTSGLLKVGLSWHGLAGPLVSEWVQRLQAEAEREQRALAEPLLFEELDEKRKKSVDRMVRQVSLWKDGRRLMEMVLGQVGRQGTNPVEVPADAFRALLWPDRTKTRTWPKGWKERVDAALTGLRALTFDYETFGTEKLKGHGGFIGEWSYVGLGPGKHGEGVYVIDVQPGFLGCLTAFESGKTRLRSGREALRFDFTKKGEKLVDDHFVTFDAGRPFYNAAAGLTPQQENLLAYLERELTLRGDTAKKGHKDAQVKRSHADAKRRRLYGASFCPLLPEGRSYFGALGHFTRNPEAGRTLYGTHSKPSRKTAGIIAEMGYSLPAGAAYSRRRKVVQGALEDLKAVVVDYLGGVVVGKVKRDGREEWVALDDFDKLDEEALCRKLRIQCFLPEDYEAKRRTQWEEAVNRRATEDIAQAKAEAWSSGSSTVVSPSENVADETLSGWPLNTRLHAAMKERGLLQKDLAPIFGVSKMTISHWIRGTEPDENGKVRGKPIPDYMAPLIVQWIETGEPPSEDDLDKARGGRRKGRG